MAGCRALRPHCPASRARVSGSWSLCWRLRLRGRGWQRHRSGARDDGRCGQWQCKWQPGPISLRLPRVWSKMFAVPQTVPWQGKQNPKNCIFSRLLTHAQQPKNGTRTAHAFACLLGSRPRASGCPCPKYRTQRRGDGTGGAARGCGGGPGRAQWASISTRIGGLCGECACGCQWGRCRRRCRWGVCRRAAIGPQS